MFSGIISDVGTIISAQNRDGGRKLMIQTHQMSLDDVAPGDSISVNGVCLTAINPNVHDQTFEADVSVETLRCTCGLADEGSRVNLEKALRLADRLGGHLVSGHVDGLGEVLGLTNLTESWKLDIRAPETLAAFIAAKGSITVNGVSLTVNSVADTDFSINLIPHTLQETTLKELKPGHPVNLEIDLIARYCERILAYRQTQ